MRTSITETTARATVIHSIAFQSSIRDAFARESETSQHAALSARQVLMIIEQFEFFFVGDPDPSVT